MQEATIDKPRRLRPRKPIRLPFPSGAAQSYEKLLRRAVAAWGAEVLTATEAAYPRMSEARRRDAEGDRLDEGGWSQEVVALGGVMGDAWNRRVRQLGPEVDRTASSLSDRHRERTRDQFMQAVSVDVIGPEPWLGDELRAFGRENARLIKNIGDDAVARVEGIVSEGVRRGQSTREIKTRIKETLGISDRRARLIARDQIGKLNGELTRLRQLDAGVTHYRWHGTLDVRERKSHREREGQVFAWDSPPPDGHPGQPVQCRCQASPVLDEFSDLTAKRPAPDLSQIPDPPRARRRWGPEYGETPKSVAPPEPKPYPNNAGQVQAAPEPVGPPAPQVKIQAPAIVRLKPELEPFRGGGFSDIPSDVRIPDDRILRGKNPRQIVVALRSRMEGIVAPTERPKIFLAETPEQARRVVRRWEKLASAAGVQFLPDALLEARATSFLGEILLSPEVEGDLRGSIVQRAIGARTLAHEWFHVSRQEPVAFYPFEEGAADVFADIVLASLIGADLSASRRYRELADGVELLMPAIGGTKWLMDSRSVGDVRAWLRAELKKRGYSEDVIGQVVADTRRDAAWLLAVRQLIASERTR